MTKPTDIDVAKKMVQLRQSALDRNYVYDLSFSTVKRLLSRKTCFYTGVEFTQEHNRPRTRTIDRVDPNTGYVEGNVVACTKYINELKGALTPAQIHMLSSKLK